MRLLLLCVLALLVPASSASAWTLTNVDVGGLGTGTVSIGGSWQTDSPVGENHELFLTIPGAGTSYWRFEGGAFRLVFPAAQAGQPTWDVSGLAAGTHQLWAVERMGEDGDNEAHVVETFTHQGPPGTPAVTSPAADGAVLADFGQGTSVVVTTAAGASVTATVRSTQTEAVLETLGPVVADSEGKATLPIPSLSSRAYRITPKAVLTDDTTLAGPTRVVVLDRDTSTPTLWDPLGPVTGPALALKVAIETPRAGEVTRLQWFLDGVQVGSVDHPTAQVVDVPLDLAGKPGRHTLRLLATDAQGHTAEATHSFVTDLTDETSATPVVTVAPDDAGARPTLTIAADPASVVTLNRAGAAPVAISADDDGKATYRFPAALPRGVEQAVTLTAKDGFDNVSAERLLKLTVASLPVVTPPPPDSRPVVTPPSPAPLPLATPARTAPKLARLTVRGTKVGFRLDRRATVTLVLQRRAGRRWRAVKTKRAVALAGRPGANAYTVRKRFGGKTLARGRYRLVVTATDGGPATSATSPAFSAGAA